MRDVEFFGKLDLNTLKDKFPKIYHGRAFDIEKDEVSDTVEKVFDFNEFMAFYKEFWSFFAAVYDTSVRYIDLGELGESCSIIAGVDNSNVMFSDVNDFLVNLNVFRESQWEGYYDLEDGNRGNRVDRRLCISEEDAVFLLRFPMHECRHLEQYAACWGKDSDPSLKPVIISAINETLNPGHYSITDENGFLNYYKMPIEIDAEAVACRRSLKLLPELSSEIDWNKYIIDYAERDFRLADYSFSGKTDSEKIAQISKAYDDAFIKSLCRQDDSYIYLMDTFTAKQLLNEKFTGLFYTQNLSFLDKMRMSAFGAKSERARSKIAEICSDNKAYQSIAAEFVRGGVAFRDFPIKNAPGLLEALKDVDAARDDLYIASDLLSKSPDEKIDFSDSSNLTEDTDIKKKRCNVAMKVAAKKLKVESFDIEEAYIESELNKDKFVDDIGAAYHMELPDDKAFENALEFTDKESLPVMINIYAVPHESCVREENRDMKAYCIDTAKSYCQKAFDNLSKSVPVMGICIDEARYKEDAAYRYDFDKAILEGVKQLKTACKNSGLNVGDKFVLGGYSDGGVASLAFAAKHPEKLAGLITGGAADVIQVADDTIAPPLGIKGMSESQVKSLSDIVQLHMIGEHEYYSEMHDHCKMRFNKPVYGTKEDTMRYAIKYKDEYEFNSNELDPIKRINRIEARNRLEGFNIKTEIVENGWHQPEEARGAPDDLTKEIVNMDDRYMHSFRRFYEGMLLKEPEPGIVIEDVREDSLEDSELDIKNGG